MHRKHKTALCVLSLLSMGLLGGVWVPLRVSIHQEQLDLALIAAIKSQDAAQAITLLDRGANPNAIDQRGDTVSVEQQLRRLLDRLKGAPPPPQRYHPSAFALSFDRNLWRAGSLKDDVWAVFLRHHANPLTKDQYGSTLLAYAAMDHYAPTVRLLMEMHVSPGLKDYCGNAPVIYTDYECARILLEHGADPNCRGACGVTPLMGTTLSDFSAGQLLLDHHARLNDRDRDGHTPLMLAFIGHKHDLTAARALLSHGARVTIRDKSGKTAMDYARKQKATVLLTRMEAIAQQERQLAGK